MNKIYFATLNKITEKYFTNKLLTIYMKYMYNVVIHVPV